MNLAGKPLPAGTLLFTTIFFDENDQQEVTKMIFIILSVLQSTLIFVTFRLFNNFRIDNWQAITVNYVVATLFGFLIYREPVSLTGIYQSPWLISAVLLGIFFISTFFVFALSSQKVGVALTSVASKMSVVIPVTFGVILYNESMSLLKIAGIAAALLAFYLTFKKKEKKKIRLLYLLYPVLMFFGNGINDTIMKYAEHYYITNDLILFLSIIFFVSLFFGLIIFTFRLCARKSKVELRSIIAGIILGLLNFGSTYYILRAMGVFESSVVFPLTNSSIVMLSAVTGFIAFREKLTPINWAGVILSIGAILIISNT
jgi:drug/metabolite transporter (DMT)-like permease